MINLDLRKIPALYLNLENHIEKNQNMQKILSECGFENIQRVEGVLRTDNPIAGCGLAHLKGLDELKPPFILFEDDCQIKNFRPVIQVPDDTDAVYLGISSWGRMNGHSGPNVQYEKVTNDLYRVYNMLSGHAILYLTPEYVDICKRVCYHYGYVTEEYHDIGFAEIQRFYNVYAFNEPMFYQMSGYHGTVNNLTDYPTQEFFTYNKQYWLPTRIY